MSRATKRWWPGISYGRGEDWHYVGESGEPAFGTTWANVSGGVALAFRIREAGVVDIYGDVAPGSTAGIFTLPVGYRPSSAVNIPIVVDTSGSLGAEYLVVTTAGTVQAVGTSGTYYYIAGQFFLDPPTITP